MATPSPLDIHCALDELARLWAAAQEHPYNAEHPSNFVARNSSQHLRLSQLHKATWATIPSENLDYFASSLCNHRGYQLHQDPMIMTEKIIEGELALRCTKSVALFGYVDEGFVKKTGSSDLHRFLAKTKWHLTGHRKLLFKALIKVAGGICEEDEETFNSIKVKLTSKDILTKEKTGLNSIELEFAWLRTESRIAIGNAHCAVDYLYIQEHASPQLRDLIKRSVEGVRWVVRSDVCAQFYDLCDTVEVLLKRGHRRSKTRHLLLRHDAWSNGASSSTMGVKRPPAIKRRIDHGIDWYSPNRSGGAHQTKRIKLRTIIEDPIYQAPSENLCDNYGWGPEDRRATETQTATTETARNYLATTSSSASLSLVDSVSTSTRPVQHNKEKEQKENKLFLQYLVSSTSSASSSGSVVNESSVTNGRTADQRHHDDVNKSDAGQEIRHRYPSSVRSRGDFTVEKCDDKDLCKNLGRDFLAHEEKLQKLCRRSILEGIQSVVCSDRQHALSPSPTEIQLWLNRFRGDEEYCMERMSRDSKTVQSKSLPTIFDFYLNHRRQRLELFLKWLKERLASLRSNSPPAAHSVNDEMCRRWDGFDQVELTELRRLWNKMMMAFDEYLKQSGDARV